MITLKNKRKAFTLIELLIVIAIIGILFIVLVSKVDFATDKAKISGVQTDFRSFQVAFEQVARENAGFATLGWDTGDVKVADFNAKYPGYSYVNELKDAGDKIRNSYDVGDKNFNGEMDEGETWTGRKVYTETWTEIYSLDHPLNASDKSGYLALEKAINKNLDPKLHITINPDTKEITMANQAQDPWKTEYHGFYLTNATNDNMDRGAIIMYSDGANKTFGCEQYITGGVVGINIPGGNIQGKDDLAIATTYTFLNGYGEVLTQTSGFGNNQGNIVIENGGTGGSGGAGSLPTPNLNGAVANAISPIAYSWSELKALAQANLSAAELRDTYGIEVGDYKEVSGVRYVLVDRGDAYGGFVFMYNAASSLVMNSTPTNAGGYAASELAPQVEALYTNLTDSDLKAVIKEVTITCNDGNANSTATHTYTAHVFLASAKEVGFNVSEWPLPDGYAAEGTCFDLFTTDDSSRTGFMSTANLSSDWWLRSAISYNINSFDYVYTNGGGYSSNATNTRVVVPAFVIG